MIKQTITIPSREVEHVIEIIKLIITDPTQVQAHIPVFQRETSEQQGDIINVSMIVNDVLNAEISAGNITAANVTGFKKCIKAICAKALKVAYTETTDPI